MYPKPAFPQDGPRGNVVKVQKLLILATNPALRATNPAPRATAPRRTPRREQFLYPKPAFPQDAPPGDVVKVQKLLTAATNPAPRFSIRAKILF
ncbi:hypothetical protein AY547_06745 [Corynebacterium diphtheriae bv. gravis]|nr:hypothetical protein [Corynebacterium diphtheriae bv. gravis]OWM47380.1 hypothetical protein BU161_08535 [Corynebacterium diphtheriae]OWM98482.1 hypothetical protein AY476_02530 [Corynebacterium diphtheriae bv. mitis]OWN08700.1 hypothetical protein AY479_03170 [Corynebacterium belfantii]OWM54573.1 hypothetical protein BU169_03245 [Corynebacterium diphtheriae]